MIMISKYTQLKIAATVLKVDIKEMAEELGVGFRHVKDVAQGNRRSKRIEKYIDQKISEADQIIKQHKDNVGE